MSTSWKCLELIYLLSIFYTISSRESFYYVQCNNDEIDYYSSPIRVDDTELPVILSNILIPIKKFECSLGIYLFGALYNFEEDFKCTIGFEINEVKTLAPSIALDELEVYNILSINYENMFWKSFYYNNNYSVQIGPSCINDQNGNTTFTNEDVFASSVGGVNALKTLISNITESGYSVESIAINSSHAHSAPLFPISFNITSHDSDISSSFSYSQQDVNEFKCYYQDAFDTTENANESTIIYYLFVEDLFNKTERSNLIIDVKISKKCINNLTTTAQPTTQPTYHVQPLSTTELITVFLISACAVFITIISCVYIHTRKKNEELQLEIKALKETQEDQTKRILHKIQQIMCKIAEYADTCKNEVQMLVSTPLHRFTENDVSNVIKSWILNDIKHIQTSRRILKIILEQSLSGDKLISLDQHLEVVLEKIVSQYMTPMTFEKTIKYVQTEIKQDENAFGNKNEEEIGQMMVDCILNSLCETIIEKQISGDHVQQNNSLFVSWIEQVTGWDKQEIKQINSILLKYKTLTSQQIKSKIGESMKHNFDSNIASIALQHIEQNEMDLAKLQLKINHMKNIDDEQAIFANMYGIIEKNQRDTGRTDLFTVADCYHLFHKLIAECFETTTDWTCFNCSNDNSRVTSICKLCGISELTSKIYSLKDLETFGSVCRSLTQNQNSQKQVPKTDEINELKEISSIDVELRLNCPDSSESTTCRSIIRLSRQLCVYQSWINGIRTKNNGKDDIKYTTNVDITQLSNEIFQKTVEKAINLTEKVTEEAKSQVIKILKTKMQMSWFTTMNRKDVLKLMKDTTKLKISDFARIYKQIRSLLRTEAHTAQFDKFFSEVELDMLFEDYHHILEVHMAKADKITKESVFIYFRHIVNCKDDYCSSLSRNEQRRFDSNDVEMTNDDLNFNDRPIWSIEQYYAQSTLDIIHSYFIHHDWKSDSHINNEEHKYNHLNKQKSFQHKKLDDMNKKKYVTEHYGFGIDYDYIHLKPQFECLRDEMLKNTIFALGLSTFQNNLMKAIKKRPIAIKQHDLMCTHYDQDYDIIRNEPIDVAHILCLIIYTDCTKYCTAYRSTYRITNMNQKEQDVMNNHRQLYWYARHLFESIEFFGKSMGKSMKVYHGLNKVLYFEKFTSYYNQPVSSTTDQITAQNFSQGVGLILIFKRGSSTNSALIPRYLDVSFLSCFPHESERLFYGKNIVFQICDIITAENMQYHSTDLKSMNLFQNCITNQKIDWTNRKKIKIGTIKHLTQLVTNQKKRNEFHLNSVDIDENESKENHVVKKYGEKLFDFFCCNKSLKWIGIRNIHSIPLLLKNVLLNSTNKYLVSFSALSILFPNCKEIVFTDINSKIFTFQCENFIMCVIKYINYVTLNENIRHNMRTITLQSNEEIESKPNATIKKISERYSQLFVELNWTIKYEFKFETYHSLSFVRTKYEAIGLNEMDRINVAMNKYEVFENMHMTANETSQNGDANNVKKEPSNTMKRADKFMRLIEQNQSLEMSEDEKEEIELLFINDNDKSNIEMQKFVS